MVHRNCHPWKNTLKNSPVGKPPPRFSNCSPRSTLTPQCVKKTRGQKIGLLVGRGSLKTNTLDNKSLLITNLWDQHVFLPPYRRWRMFFSRKYIDSNMQPSSILPSRPKAFLVLGTPRSGSIYLELQTTNSLWLFQLEDSKSLHGKWLFHQTSFYKWLFGVPGIYIYLLTEKILTQSFLGKNLGSFPPKMEQFNGLREDIESIGQPLGNRDCQVYGLMECRFGRWSSFSIGWFLGSMLIFRGVKGTIPWIYPPPRIQSWPPGWRLWRLHPG